MALSAPVPVAASQRAGSADGLLVAIDLFALLVTFLGLDRERRDRPRFEPLQRDRLAGLLAIAIGIVLDALKCGIDLGDQFALAVAGTQFDRPVGLGGG